MRILHVIQEMRTGGAERIVVSLARGAAAAGHEVAVASAPGELLAEIGEAPHFDMPIVGRRARAVPAAVLDLRRPLRRWRPDIVHCHNPGMGVVTSIVTLRGRRPPALVSVHGVPDEDWAKTARLLRLARLPAVACGPGVQAALDEHGLRVAATIWNGVSPAPRPADRAQLEREWNLPVDYALLLAVGRLVPAKNHQLALRALVDIPNATLAIVGDGPLAAELMQQAQAAGVGDRVVLAGLRNDARALMGAADVVVVSSRSEGLPMVVLEALAAGTPVVATAVRGIRELLTHDQDSLLAEPGDVDGLAAAVVRVLSDRELAARITAAGRALAAAHSDEAMVTAFLELYARRAA